MSSTDKNDLVDALPYIDDGYDEPGVREAVLLMIEEETKRYKPTKNYLEYLGPPVLDSFLTNCMRHEFEKLEKKKPREPLNMKRYELPPPPPNRLNDVNAWQDSVRNSEAQLEHQTNRIVNLQVMSKHGKSVWLQYNDRLEKYLSEARKELNALSQEMQEINYLRKKEQTETGKKLGHLETNWVGLVSKNYEIEQACVDLEEEISAIKQHEQPPHSSAHGDQTDRADPTDQADPADPADQNNPEHQEDQDVHMDEQEPVAKRSKTDEQDVEMEDARSEDSDGFVIIP